MELKNESDSNSQEIRSEVLNSEPTNPVLQRLKRRVLGSAEASEVISSYDRMHHRHNRS
jgi:hypothetical protein